MNGDEQQERARGFNWHFLTYALGLCLAALVSYNVTTNSFNARISVLERRQDDSERRLERIENKIDVLLSLNGRAPLP